MTTAPLSEPSAGAYAPAIIETVREPLLVLDPELRVELVNPAFCSTFHLSEDETLGRLIYELADGQWDIPELRTLLEQVIPRDREVRDFKVRASFPHVGHRTVMLNAREIRLGGETRRKILVAMDDVTDRERATRRLERYAHELERSNRELEEFAHAASHDLQEPLRKIRTYGDRLEAALEQEELAERSARYIEGMVGAARRMQQRIDDLLQLARVGQEKANLRETDLREVVAAVLEELEVAVADTAATVEVAPDLPTLQADPAQFRLLFQNLVANALKYAGEGRSPVVRIGWEAMEPPENRPEHPWVRLVVEDDGIGFDPEYAERIFRPFQRLHGRAEYEGSGVGLAVCRRVVHHHHGRIHAEGRPGEGARFIVEVPVRHPFERSPDDA